MLACIRANNWSRRPRPWGREAGASCYMIWSETCCPQQCRYHIVQSPRALISLNFELPIAKDRFRKLNDGNRRRVNKQAWIIERKISKWKTHTSISAFRISSCAKYNQWNWYIIQSAYAVFHASYKINYRQSEDK